MALALPCTGKQLLEEVNDLSENVANSYGNITTTLENAYDDNFHIADLVTTTRDSLGEDYLLCDGDVLYEWGEHSDIIPYVDEVASKWYYECPRNGKLFSVDSAIFQLTVEAEYEDSKKVRDVVVCRKFDTLKDFVKGNASLKSNIYGCINNTDTIRILLKTHCTFGNRLYLSLFDYKVGKTKVITCSSNINPTLWKEVISEDGNTSHHIVASNKMVCWIEGYRENDAVDHYRYNVRYKTSVDGEVFSSEQFGATRVLDENWSLYSDAYYYPSYTFRPFLGNEGIYITFDGGTANLDKIYFGDIDYTDSFPSFSFTKCSVATATEAPWHTDITLLNDGKECVFLIMMNSLNTKHLGVASLHGAGTAGETPVGYKINGSYPFIYDGGGKIFIRNNKYYLLGYDGFSYANNNEYVVIELGDYNVSYGCYNYSEYSGDLGSNKQNYVRKRAKLPNCSNRNISLHNEGRDFYIYDTGTTFQIVPKKDGIISSLPTISLGTGLNTYIKVKE